MNKDELISIIVPIYDVEKYLNRCIVSILNQTYKNFELILVDDGSNDQCPKICDEWAKKDGRISVIHKKNGGLSDARNAGIKVAEGEYIAFVDSDDWVSEFYLEYLRKALIENDCDIVECEIIRVSENVSGENESIKKYDKASIYETEKALEYLIADQRFHQYVWNKLYKRSVIQGILFEKGKTNEDEFWTYQIFGNAKRVGKIEIPLYYYLYRDTSIMGAKYSIKRLDALDAKLQRQKYIEEKYPRLGDIAKINLFTSCIYQGQMCLLNLEDIALVRAKKHINFILSQIDLSLNFSIKLSVGEKIWICCAKYFFWSTCFIKNILKKGF